jgi:tetratricopeptide (TPR) repeat protein
MQYTRFSVVVIVAILFPSTAASAISPIDSSRVSTDTLTRAALALHVTGHYIDAVKTFLRAGADTGSAADRFNLGMSYSALNDAEHAKKYLQSAVLLDSINVNYRYQFARSLVQAGAAKDGQAQYEKTIQLDSTYIPALFSLGMLHNDSRSYEMAADMFNRVLALNENDFLSNYYLGSALVGLGNQDSASVYLSTCLKLNPSFVPAINVLASIHYVKKRFADALVLYQLAFSLRPNSAEFIHKVGLCHRNLDQYLLAASAFRKAADLDSLSAPYFGNLGHAYFRLEKYDSSIFAYNRAVALDNENSIFLLNLALALQKLDSVESAAVAYRKAISNYHSNEVADIYVKLGSLYFLHKKNQEAIEAYQASLRFDPENRNAQFYIGSAYDDLADIPTAIRNYTRYVKLAEDDPTETNRVKWTKIRLKALNDLQAIKKK